MASLFETSAPILIAGPTASGKSGLANALALKFGGCVINADALQVYDCWQILTARPSVTEQQGLPHALYGYVGMDEDYSVGRWLKDIQTTLNRCRDENLRPIIVGGTGLYFSALTEGLSDIPAIPADVREAGNVMKSQDPHEFALIILRDDPETAAKTDLANPVRTQRAWEVLTATGHGLSYWHKRGQKPLLTMDDVVPLVLRSDPNWLNTRIDTRFDQMIELGALEECCDVLTKNYDPNLPSCRAIGAAELISHLHGRIDLQAAVDTAKIQTRRYAKRQRTWFRNRMANWTEIDPRQGYDHLLA